MTYRAVVKYPLDASDEDKRRALVEGLNEIAMELVAEHDYDLNQIEDVFEDAYSYAQDEHDAKRMRAEGA